MLELEFGNWSLGLVNWENVLWLINIGTEFEVVDLSDVAFVQVLSDEKLEQSLIRRNDFQFFQSSSELLNSDMARFGPIVVLERWLNENSLVSNLSSNSSKDAQNGIHFIFSEVRG